MRRLVVDAGKKRGDVWIGRAPGFDLLEPSLLLLSPRPQIVEPSPPRLDRGRLVEAVLYTGQTHMIAAATRLTATSGCGAGGPGYADDGRETRATRKLPQRCAPHIPESDRRITPQAPKSRPRRP